MLRAGQHKAVAYKALTLVAGLSASDRRVGGALIDHYNLKTGRCDPGVVRLARLLRISPASVKRATEALDKAELIAKQQHGGLSHSNSYEPNWRRFKNIVDDWDARMKAPTVAEVIPSGSQNCDADSSNIETQTLLTNPSKETIRESDRALERSPPKQKVTLERAPSNRVAEFSSYKPRKSARPADVARKMAYQRWRVDFFRSGGTWEDLMEVSDEDLERANDAEASRHGTGVELIHAMLMKSRLEGHQRTPEAGVGEPSISSPEANETTMHPDVAQEADVASLPFVITKAQRMRLRELGYQDEEIKNMRPEDAQNLLKQTS
jgi:hypothetical protein